MTLPLAVRASGRVVAAPGYSDVARQSNARRRYHRARLAETISFNDGRGAVIEALRQQAVSCQKLNWDGYGAQPVESTSLQTAIEFIESLPLHTTMPTVGAEPDGHLTLEWYKAPDWVLSVSVSDDEMLYYAAVLGHSRMNGAEPFFGWVPDTILQLIRKV